MNNFVIVEIGSTTTKAYLYTNGKVNKIASQVIEFKNNYKKEQKIADKDKLALFNFINNLNHENIYVYGTSIFRNLPSKQKEEWLKEFRENTGYDFTIVTSDMENELTVYGAISDVNYKDNIAVMIGGGGSTELSIVNNGKIIEKHNFNFGAVDVTEKYPDLKEDKATTPIDEMLKRVKELLTDVDNKAPLLILAGGDYIYFYEELNYNIPPNKFYKNSLQPYCLDKELSDKLDNDFFYNVSLDNIGKKTNNSSWWNGARGMRICVRAIIDLVNANYIVPTRINMVYGIVEKIKNSEVI